MDWHLYELKKRWTVSFHEVRMVRRSINQVCMLPFEIAIGCVSFCVENRNARLYLWKINTWTVRSISVPTVCELKCQNKRIACHSKWDSFRITDFCRQQETEYVVFLLWYSAFRDVYQDCSVFRILEFRIAQMPYPFA